jgi:hypothetical protein
MKTLVLFLTAIFAIATSGCRWHNPSTPRVQDTLLISDTIQYHAVRINKADGSILPWYSSDPGTSYDTVLLLVWNFWDKMETDSNGLKYYLNHQVWKPEHDMRGLGGDQINMALSSWTLLFAYTGNPSVLENMIYLADNYLERSLSDSTDAWPFLPYPYNTAIHSGKYDGDMRNGKGFLQPDKAGNFGYELLNLYKITGDKKYLIYGDLLVNSFDLENKEGGFTNKTINDGWWYEEYAGYGGDNPQVLDGMMFATIGLYEYYNYTKNPQAKYFFDMGVIALTRNIANYDDNGNSFYDILGNPSNEYHQIHIDLSRKLYNITDKKIFIDYSNKWKDYKEPLFIDRFIKNPEKLSLAILIFNIIIIFSIFELLFLIRKYIKK